MGAGKSGGGYRFFFEKLLDEYIVWDAVNLYMEIGGAPGSIMAFMNKSHNLSVSTVDFTEKEKVSEYLRDRRVENFKVYQDDFSTFDVRQHHRKYDIVASWGFLEHFGKTTAAKFIEKQKDMVTEGGYFIVEIPNIRKIFWLLYRIFNRRLLRIHNLEVMNLEWLKRCVVKGCNFELLYASYYFAMNPQNEYFVKHARIRKICEKVVAFFEGKNFDDDFKSWFFPYIVIIAKKKGLD